MGARSALETILERVIYGQLGSLHLCEFLFDNNHRRWRQLITALQHHHANVHLAVPLLKLMLRCKSVSGIIADWDDLMSSRTGPLCRTYRLWRHKVNMVEDAF